MRTPASTATVTEAATAMAALQESEQRFGAIVNSIDQLQFDSKLEHFVVMAMKPQDFKQVALSLAPHLKTIAADRLHVPT